MATLTKKPRRKSVLKQIEALADKNLAAFVRAFLECAIWNEDNSIDGDYNLGRNPDIQMYAQATLESALAQSKEFIEYCQGLGYLPTEVDTELFGQAGHDFWLSRAGAGVGFFDRGELYGETLSGQDIGDLMHALCGYGARYQHIDLEKGGRYLSFMPLYNEPTQPDEYRAKYNPAKYKQEAKDELGPLYNEALSRYDDEGYLKPGYMQGRGAA